MKITKYWWIGACVLTLACEASEDAAGHDAVAVTDAVSDVCEAEDDGCGVDGPALELAHDGRCGNHPSLFEVAAVEAEMSERIAAAPYSPGARVAIPVYVHVISDGDKGNVSEEQITQQMEKINAAFVGTGFTFSLVDVSRTNNPAWYLMAMDSAAESQAKKALRRGGAGALNMYIVNAVNLLGWATFPWWYPFDPKSDGIVVDYATLPGGSVKGFNSGATAVHEVGHWLGLYHTFQNGCSLVGDSVSDTPAEQSPASGCPTGRDSCKGSGADPVNNYMDYSNDDCRSKFTPGQRNRMAWFHALFR